MTVTHVPGVSNYMVLAPVLRTPKLSHKSAGFLVGVRGFGFSLDSKVLTHEITWST